MVLTAGGASGRILKHARLQVCPVLGLKVRGVPYVCHKAFVGGLKGKQWIFQGFLYSKRGFKDLGLGLEAGECLISNTMMADLQASFPLLSPPDMQKASKTL